MLTYRELLLQIVDETGWSFKQAMECKWESGARRCEACKLYGFCDDMETSGGIRGEPEVCEWCFEHSQSAIAEDARQAVASQH